MDNSKDITIKPGELRGTLLFVDMIGDVKRFQKHILNKEFPAQPEFSDELIAQTLTRLDEEVEEFDLSDKTSDRADALIDLIYFALGALHQAGVDTARVWTEVHRANMTKQRGVTHRGDDNDAAKPEEWKAPDHTWLDTVEVVN